MKILLVDDQVLFSEGLRSLLAAGGHTVVGAARDGVQAVEMARSLHPDVVLMEIGLPNLNGLVATRLIKTELPEVLVVILTNTLNDADLFEAIKCGASGYLLKNLLPSELFGYLEGLSQGAAPLSREVSTRLLQEFSRQANALDRLSEKAAPPVSLTARQVEILTLAARGMTYKEIAAILDLSEHTIKYHMGEIIQRLHLKNREQVVTYALRAGLVQSRLEKGKA